MKRSITIYTGALLLLLATQTYGAILLVNSGFETIEGTIGFPSTVVDWGGDDSAIVTTQQGISPHSGSQMLHHIFTGNIGSAGVTANSQVWQLVDLSPFAAEVASGLAVALGSAYVNRISEDAETDTQFLVAISAHSGSPASFPSNPNGYLAVEVGEIFTDGSVATWEFVDVQLSIPVGATYLAYQIISGEDILNDVTGTEFDGHYSDDAFLDVITIPEPSRVSLITLALAATLTRRARKA